MPNYQKAELLNLKAEMTRSHVTYEDIQHLLGLSERAVRMRLDGEIPFSYPEAEKIRDTHFRGMRLEYLMTRDITEQQAG